MQQNAGSAVSRAERQVRRQARDEIQQAVTEGAARDGVSVLTGDLRAVTAAVGQLDVGILHINSETAGADPHVPFGGVKASGFGPKEQGRAAREFFTTTKTVYLRSSQGGMQ
ncbi:aldehyde dehydrogenase family protein [Streptomyces sp. SYSU K21746]